MAKKTHNALTLLHKIKSGIINILCVIVIFNAISPAFAQPKHLIALCTSLGIQWVQIEDIGQTKQTAHHCIFCLNINDDEATLFSNSYFPKRIEDTSEKIVLQTIPETISAPISKNPRGPPDFL